MHIDVVPNRGSRPAVLLRESYREGKRVRKRTLANLLKLPMEQVEAIRRILRGDQLAPLEQVFEIVEGGSRHHGHVDAVLVAMKRLGFPGLIASRPSRERDLVMAMGVGRIVESQSKLAISATSAWWHTTTLPTTLGVTCPLAAFGHNRDGKKGKLQVNYGLLTNPRGVPVSISVFEGSTGDPKTLLPQVEKVQNDFGIERVVLVGDRGMITQKQVDVLRGIDGVGWIAALRPEAIKKLVNSGVIQMDLFDERNLFELRHPDFPGERLVACRNPELAKRPRPGRFERFTTKVPGFAGG